MKKLIKLSNNHYIIVDNSEIKEGDFVYDSKDKVIRYVKKYLKDDWINKITHSTRPLEEVIIYKSIGWQLGFDKIKELNLSEVEEFVYGYSDEMMIENHYDNFKLYPMENITPIRGALKRFCIDLLKAQKELMKDKLFTMEDVEKIWKYSLYCAETHNKNGTKNKSTFIENDVNEFIQSLLPKTEWDIEIVNDKIKLI